MIIWVHNIRRGFLLLALAALSACAAVPAPALPPVVEAVPVEVEPQATDVEAPPELPLADAEPAAAAGELPAVPPAPRYKRADVVWIQERLQELGYYVGSVDGAVGKATRNAIRAYQVDQGVATDGRPTGELREFMWRNGG